jgi:hypothetical protein
MHFIIKIIERTNNANLVHMDASATQNIFKSTEDFPDYMFRNYALGPNSVFIMPVCKSQHWYLLIADMDTRILKIINPFYPNQICRNNTWLTQFVSFLEEFDKKNNTNITTGDKIWETRSWNKTSTREVGCCKLWYLCWNVFGYFFPIKIPISIPKCTLGDKFRLIYQLELFSKSEKMPNKFCCHQPTGKRIQCSSCKVLQGL